MNYKIVVNKDNPYNKNDFSNIELKKIKNSSDEEYLLEKRTLKAFLNLKEDLKKDNIYIDLASAYRTYEEQERIIDKLKQEKGIDKVTEEKDINKLKNQEYEKLADMLMKNLNINKIYEIIEKGVQYGKR